MVEQIKDFLSSLYGSSEGRVSVWWRNSPGSKSPYSQSAWFTWPRDRDDMAEYIESLSDKDVCVTTATYSEDRRTPEYTKDTQSIWMDSDVCEGSNYRIAPSWTVTTSSGRWQHFWTLDSPVTAMQASELSHRMSVAHDKQGADQSSWPANKIMRVPGTMNTSHGFPTLVKGSTTGEVYSYTELLAAYEDVSIPNRALVREIPELSVEELPPYGNVIAKLSQELLDLAMSEPKPDQDRSRLRYKLLLELFRFGLSYDEVLSVAWNAPASRKWREEDPRGLDGLAIEAVKAAQEAGQPRDVPVDPFSASVDDNVELALDKPVTVLTDEERVTLVNNKCFIQSYNEFARARLPHDNDPYDRANAWALLSLAYSDTGYFLDGTLRTTLNLYTMLLGETTTGKTTSFRLLKSILREYFYQDPEFNLGGNASESALVKALHARDGKVSFFNSDEASGVLKVWLTQDWSGGMKERITELYDGDVTPLLRSGKGESVNKTSKTFFSVFLQGTQRGIMEHLTPDLFHSGLLPRFVFTIGKPPSRGSFDVTESDEEGAGDEFDPAARQMAAVLRSNRDYLREEHDGPARISFRPEVRKRLKDAMDEIQDRFVGSNMEDMIRPSIIRWSINVRKAACLLAMDRRSTDVEMIDMLHALEAGEEWFTNLLRILHGLSSSVSERACNEMYGYINGRGGRVTSRALYNKFARFRGFEMDDYLRSLARQGRVSEVTENKTVYYVTDTYRERN